MTEAADTAAPLEARLPNVRTRTMVLAEPLSDADATVQSMADASPAKWHLAHTSWFFETFVLAAHVPGYAPYDEAFGYLFNSYYEAAGPRHTRARRGMLTRPSLARIRDYRRHVDEALRAALPALGEGARALVELGLQHEQQHQELLLTDILHLFSQNPIEPVYAADGCVPAAPANATLDWVRHDGGIAQIGHHGCGSAFDCEGPRHKVLLEPFALANRLVSNAEWGEFIDDGGYDNASLWLSDGWTWVRKNEVRAPLYWRMEPDNRPTQFSLRGRRIIDPAAPVTHISYYEADAFATWAGVRLPTEAEWEVAAPPLTGAFGQCWQWTGSAYLPYPRFKPAAGAVGEYNGKFMSGQFVLRGSSCASAPGHSRATYRNFFYPRQRWQFAGLRLAKSL